MHRRSFLAGLVAIPLVTDAPRQTAAVTASGKPRIVGPWLREVPKPTLKLGTIGLRKYEELAGALLAQKSLTPATAMDCEMVAFRWQAVLNTIASRACSVTHYEPRQVGPRLMSTAL